MSDKTSLPRSNPITTFLKLEVDSEIELGDFTEFEGSGIMSGSGADNPCVDRSFVGQTLYRCLGDFMKEAYVAKIEQREMKDQKKCTLFEEGFRCFEKKIQTDFGDQCTARDLYNTASWFKTEIFTDFGVDIRGCPYPDIPPTTISPTPPGRAPFVDIRETSQVAMVAGIVLGVAVMSILTMIFFVIFKRRILGATAQCQESQHGKRKPFTAPPPGGALQQPCKINITDTRSTLTGLSSEHSLHHTSYETTSVPRAPSQHIYTEIDTINEISGGPRDDNTRVAPVGCSTFMTGYVPPEFSYSGQGGYHNPVKDMTVEYVASGGYYTHAHVPVYQSTTVPL
ncbi:uncharacterized protein LOC134234534 isoform X2 [Saccostrea cucullata]|uniref:uncharacterized protein LOC134234534 isoform X2 n=2 Tax=Saccostrea cuccullata TaxID=36930 RepID=UPI002ED07AB3